MKESKQSENIYINYKQKKIKMKYRYLLIGSVLLLSFSCTMKKEKASVESAEVKLKIGRAHV